MADFYGETVSSHWWGLLELAVVEPVLVKLRVAASGRHSRICNVEASPGETVSSHWWGTLSTFSESTCSHDHNQSQLSAVRDTQLRSQICGEAEMSIFSDNQVNQQYDYLYHVIPLQEPHQSLF